MLRQWYVIQEKHQNGPLSHDEMVHFIESKFIKLADLAWTEGMVEWLRLDQINEFIHLFSSQEPL